MPSSPRYATGEERQRQHEHQPVEAVDVVLHTEHTVADDTAPAVQHWTSANRKPSAVPHRPTRAPSTRVLRRMARSTHEVKNSA
jgi:hypothetical protein